MSRKLRSGRTYQMSKWVGVIFTIAAILGTVVIVGGMLFKGIIDLEHYTRVYQNPLRATATVIRHEVDENDDDTDYLSYISYTVNGVRYADIRYENKNKNAELTPIGQKVTVEVSPEDPSVLIADLLKTRFSTEFSTIMVAFVAAAGWRGWTHRKRSKNLVGAPDQEQLERDLRLTVYGRMSLSSWLILAILTGALWWRYPLFIEGWVKYVAVGSIVIWLISLVVAIGCLRVIKNQEYRVTRDILVEKSTSYDSEDGFTYTLTYQTDCGTRWDKNTTERIYTILNEGSGVIAVYMPGKQKPVLHYDGWGNAE